MNWMQTHPTRYPTDLTYEEWEYIKSLVPARKSGKAKRGRPLHWIVAVWSTPSFIRFAPAAPGAGPDNPVLDQACEIMLTSVMPA